MSELPRPLSFTVEKALSAVSAGARTEKSAHYALIKNTAPDWLTQASLSRLHTLAELPLQQPSWYRSTSAAQHETLQRLNADAWRLQNAIDLKLQDMQDVYAFATPLLTQTIKQQYGLELDVKTTYLNIYTSKALPWYALKLSDGFTSRKVSLLDAALHNFATKETFAEHSCYISQPDYRGHFRIHPYHRTMSLEQFKALCRELDLGSRYQRHLSDYLLPTEPVAQAFLKLNVIASQKAALKAAAFMALSKEELSRGAYAVVTGVLDGTENRAHCYQLNLLDTPLTGILLIARDLENISSVSKLIAYIPHDPISPVKEYDSSTEFMRDLARKLRLNAPLLSSQKVPPATYQLFFSQFVPHSHRGQFFRKLSKQLYEGRWDERGPQEPGPEGCELWTSTPMLQFNGVKIVGLVWEQLYQTALNKIINDGSSLIVSTAQADNNQRWAWWENVLRIGSDLLNAALLVVTPFVPLLGELMLAYTAYQLTDELVEGIVDLSEDQLQDAAQHFCAVLTDVLQLALMAAGGTLTKELLFKPSPFVESLKPVQVGDKTRLWSPDLSPYARKNLALPTDSKPNRLGLHDYQRQTLLRLDERLLLLDHDAQSATYRVKHPTRSTAYSPAIEPNGSGAWVHEGEDPWTWDATQLRSRLGHITQGLGPGEIEQACTNSGTDAAALRKMYLDLEPTPPLLDDSLNRLKYSEAAAQLPGKVRAGQPTEEWFTWSAQLTTSRQGWPANKAIQVFSDAHLRGEPMNYGNGTHALKISQQQIMAGTLPEELVEFLTESELESLLSKPLPETSEARIQTLRNQTADALERNKIGTFNHLYSSSELLATEPAKLLKKTFPQLTDTLVQRALLRTSPNEVTQMSEHQHIPLRVKNLARELHNEVVASHAYEGFSNDLLLSADTERLALNTLRSHSDALGELNITVREQEPDGAVRSEAGAQDGATKTLLRQENGLYEIYTPDSHGTQPQYDFFEALLRALPHDKVEYVPGQGQLFKLWLKDKLASTGERRTLLEPPTLRQSDRREALNLLQKPMIGSMWRVVRGEPWHTVESRIRRLCPLNDAQAPHVLTQLQTVEGQRRLSMLEAEKKELQKALDKWANGPIVVSQDDPILRRYIADQLRSNWESNCPGRLVESAADTQSASLDLSYGRLTRYARDLVLPRGAFNHVTELNLSNTRPRRTDMKFLNHFPNVSELNLSRCELTEVPEQLGTLRHLTHLDLSENPDIPWEARDLNDVYRCARLEHLSLHGNSRLHTPPDLNRLPHIRTLILRRTSIDQWPEGLNTPRVSLVELNLLDTRIHDVPEYGQDSPAARVIANSWLDRATLDVADSLRFADYRRTFGIDPDRRLPTSDPQDSAFWVRGRALNERSDAQRIWDDLEREPNAEGFFKILKMLTPPDEFHDVAERTRFEQGRKDLIDRAWELMIALHGDAQLRERMFNEASAPTHCADASATIFNTMGVELLKTKILADTTPEGLAARQRRLLKLARQKWRLDQVGKAARAHIAHRTNPVGKGGLGQTFGSNSNQVDEVEVYLAYQTGLKQRLDLPWLSEHMVYRHLSGVTQAQLNVTYEFIQGLEKGDELLDGMLEQAFWNDVVEQDTPVAQAREQFEATFNVLYDELQPKQKEWCDSVTTAQRKAELHDELVELLARLNSQPSTQPVITAADIFTQSPLTEAAMSKLYNAAKQGYQEAKRAFTRRALGNASA